MSQPARRGPLGHEELVSEVEYLQNVVHGAMHEDPAGLRTLTADHDIPLVFLSQTGVRRDSKSLVPANGPRQTKSDPGYE
jgi:hypothetical protein